MGSFYLFIYKVHYIDLRHKYSVLYYHIDM